ncbi:MAG: NfeD family protein [Myxococcota bacterium]
METKVRRGLRLGAWSLMLAIGLGGVVQAQDASPDAEPPAADVIGEADAQGPEAPQEAVEAPGEGEEQASKGEEQASKARKRPPKTIRVEMKDGGAVYWITIEEIIDLGLAPYVERVVLEANADEDAVAVVSRIHTPGGRVDAAVRIRDALLKAEIPTLAFIDSEAISAGALIALAHDYIVMVPGGTIGAATPIQSGGGGGEAQPVGEKMTSYVRGVFRATAETKDRDPVVAEAMVDAKVHVPGLAPEGKLLTATSKEALEWGIADLVVDDREDFLAQAGLEEARIERRETSWAEEVARVLTHPMLSGMLMTFGFLGLLMEFYSPGFGIIGGIGITCLLLFFFGHQAVHLAGFEELALFFVGLALIVVEVFVTPGFGILGALGLVAILAALVMTLIAYPLDVSIDTGELTTALLRVLGSIALTILILMVAGVRLARSGPFRRLVLADEIAGRAVGFGEAGPDAEGRERLPDEIAPAVGAVGVARSSLRPSGKVRVDGRTYDAVTTGELIAAGDRVEVRGTRGSALVVREAPAERGEAPDDA